MQSNSEPYLTLLVEDKTFRTTQSTLTKYPESNLAKTFSDAGIMTMKTSEGQIFVDRDPQYFAHILAFLRTGRIKYEKDIEANTFILAEFDFWELPLPNDSEINLKQLPDSYDHKNRHIFRTTRPIHFYCDVIIYMGGHEADFKIGDTSLFITEISKGQKARVIFDARKKIISVDGKEYKCTLPVINFELTTYSTNQHYAGIFPVMEQSKEFVKK